MSKPPQVSPDARMPKTWLEDFWDAVNPNVWDAYLSPRQVFEHQQRVQRETEEKLAVAERERDRLREALRDLYRLIVYDSGTLFEIAPGQRERVEDVLRRAAVLVEEKP